MVTVYLAGAIRDGNLDDIGWREKVIDQVYNVLFLNPLGGKSYNAKDKTWLMGGIPPSARHITAQDKWSVEHSDVVVVNLTSLSEGYPSIGTLIEFGIAVAGGKLIYTIMPGGFTGVQNAIYKVHPFVEMFSAQVFDNVDAFLDFFTKQAGVLNGMSPRMLGVKNGE